MSTEDSARTSHIGSGAEAMATVQIGKRAFCGTVCQPGPHSNCLGQRLGALGFPNCSLSVWSFCKGAFTKGMRQEGRVSCISRRFFLDTESCVNLGISLVCSAPSIKICSWGPGQQGLLDPAIWSFLCCAVLRWSPAFPVKPGPGWVPVFFLIGALFLPRGRQRSGALVSLPAPCSSGASAPMTAGVDSRLLPSPSSQSPQLSLTNVCCPFYFTGGGDGGSEKTKNSSQLRRRR